MGACGLGTLLLMRLTAAYEHCCENRDTAAAARQLAAPSLADLALPACADLQIITRTLKSASRTIKASGRGVSWV